MQVETGAAILKLLQCLQFNAHEIYEKLVTENHFIIGSKVQGIGVAIYKTASLFNHDCYPNVTRYFSGKHIVITTTMPISKGNIVSENYGPIFSQVPRKERQRILRSRYWFTCECTACKEDWPLLKDLSDDIRIRCPTKGCKNIFTKVKGRLDGIFCSLCKENISLKESIELSYKCEDLYMKAAELLNVSFVFSIL